MTVQKFQSLLHANELASLGPEPRANRDSLQFLENKLHQIFSETKLSATAQPLVRSLVLLWHDYLDESHSISQDIHSADGSFLHGIMHRREPDYGNANYWFHKVGAHPCFSVIAANVAEFLTNENAGDLRDRLIREGNWDASAFIEVCEESLKRDDAVTIKRVQRVQEIEFRALLQHFVR